MSQRPVIFLAFANDQDAHLEKLKQEGKDIYRTLQARHDQQYIELYREESAAIDDIFYNFNRYKDRVAIFHYGGHASGTHLRLEDRDANAGGLAKMFGEQTALQLVVLNGCSTRNQVARLLEAGVKAVVATSVPINDGMASEFAVQLYHSLANGGSIRNAFNQAVAFLETKYGNTQSAGIFRSADWSEEPEAENVPMPWGLYVNPQAETVLDWKLPDHKKVSLPAGFGVSGKENFKVNQYIVTVLEAMANYNKALYREMEDEFGDPRDPREFPELIIKNFPWPIGAQLRILVANSDMMNVPGLSRLRQLIYSYIVSSKFLCYLLLAQLWEVKNKGSQNLDSDILNSFLSITPEKADGYDFFSLTNEAREFFREQKIAPYVKELEEVFKSLETQDEMYQAYQFLENVRGQLAAQNISEGELAQLCNESEFCLSVILKKIAFLAIYRLLTIKDISIFKPRHREPLFRVQMGVLNAFDNEFLREKSRDQDIFTDSHSILLVKDLRDIDHFLNLSPFIVDKNAFSGKPIPNVYMFNSRSGNFYEYLSVNFNVNKPDPDAPDKISTEDQSYAVLQEQFQLFTK
ncbi:MAG: CHAT domain-containing protein [Bacteroidia bacterium]|nr:CHAT domain-containing protein [Bacteroidia bacterium]